MDGETGGRRKLYRERATTDIRNKKVKLIAIRMKEIRKLEKEEHDEERCREK